MCEQLVQAVKMTSLKAGWQHVPHHAARLRQHTLAHVGRVAHAFA